MVRDCDWRDGKPKFNLFFQVEDARLQRIQVILLAVFIGQIIFMIFALARRTVGYFPHFIFNN